MDYQKLRKWKSNTLLDSKGNILPSKGVFCFYYIESFLKYTSQVHYFCVMTFLNKKCVSASMVASEMLALFEVDLHFSLWCGLQRSTEHLKVLWLYFYRLGKNYTIMHVSVIHLICLGTEQDLKLFPFQMGVISLFLSMVKFYICTINFICWSIGTSVV